MAIRKLTDAAKLANPERSQFRNSRNSFPFQDPNERKPRWFPAQYAGECSSCWHSFDEGFVIRADGQGGWEGLACCNDDE